MRTSNPAFNSDTFSGFGYVDQTMTVYGTVNKSVLLLLLSVISASVVWAVPSLSGIGLVASLPAFILAIATTFKPEWARITAPIYSVLKGLALGGISLSINYIYPGLPIQAVVLTFGVFFTMMIAYRSGIIRASEKFVLGVAAATGGIAIFYLISWVIGFFGISNPLISGNGLLSIGFSIVVVIIAALNLILDFENIKTGEQRGAPQYMEWYSAFSLMITLIWLYVEILILLTKLAGRNQD